MECLCLHGCFDYFDTVFCRGVRFSGFFWFWFLVQFLKILGDWTVRIKFNQIRIYNRLQYSNFHSSFYGQASQKLAKWIKGSSDQSHFIFEINVGKSRIRHTTTLNLNDAIFNRFWVDLEIHHSISESFYIGSDSFRHWFQKYNGWGLNYS